VNFKSHDFTPFNKVHFWLILISNLILDIYTTNYILHYFFFTKQVQQQLNKIDKKYAATKKSIPPVMTDECVS